MKDTNDREIKIGDYVLYGYGFRKAIVGLVEAIHKNGVKMSFKAKITRINGNIGNVEDTLHTTVCKKMDHVVVVTDLIDNQVFRDLFEVDEFIRLLEKR